MKTTWQTKIAAILSVCAITIYAMHMNIDGITVPVVGVAIISGIAGHEIGREEAQGALAKFLGEKKRQD